MVQEYPLKSNFQKDREKKTKIKRWRIVKFDLRGYSWTIGPFLDHFIF